LRFPTLRLPISATGGGRLRSHQRSSELVATLDAASEQEVVFLYILRFSWHYQAYAAKKMNVSELARVCKLSRPTVYKYLKLVL